MALPPELAAKKKSSNPGPATPGKAPGPAPEPKTGAEILAENAKKRKAEEAQAKARARELEAAKAQEPEPKPEEAPEQVPPAQSEEATQELIAAGALGFTPEQPVISTQAKIPSEVEGFGELVDEPVPDPSRPGESLATSRQHTLEEGELNDVPMPGGGTYHYTGNPASKFAYELYAAQEAGKQAQANVQEGGLLASGERFARSILPFSPAGILPATAMSIYRHFVPTDAEVARRGEEAMAAVTALGTLDPENRLSPERAFRLAQEAMQGVDPKDVSTVDSAYGRLYAYYLGVKLKSSDSLETRERVSKDAATWATNMLLATSYFGDLPIDVRQIPTVEQHYTAEWRDLLPYPKEEESLGSAASRAQAAWKEVKRAVSPKTQRMPGGRVVRGETLADYMVRLEFMRGSMGLAEFDALGQGDLLPDLKDLLGKHVEKGSMALGEVLENPGIQEQLRGDSDIERAKALATLAIALLYDLKAPTVTSLIAELTRLPAQYRVLRPFLEEVAQAAKAERNAGKTVSQVVGTIAEKYAPRPLPRELEVLNPDVVAQGGAAQFGESKAAREAQSYINRAASKLGTPEWLTNPIGIPGLSDIEKGVKTAEDIVRVERAREVLHNKSGNIFRRSEPVTDAFKESEVIKDAQFRQEYLNRVSRRMVAKDADVGSVVLSPRDLNGELLKDAIYTNPLMRLQGTKRLLEYRLNLEAKLKAARSDMTVIDTAKEAQVAEWKAWKKAHNKEVLEGRLNPEEAKAAENAKRKELSIPLREAVDSKKAEIQNLESQLRGVEKFEEVYSEASEFERLRMREQLRSEAALPSYFEGGPPQEGKVFEERGPAPGVPGDENANRRKPEHFERLAEADITALISDKKVPGPMREAIAGDILFRAGLDEWEFPSNYVSNISKLKYLLGSSAHRELRMQATVERLDAIYAKNPGLSTLYDMSLPPITKEVEAEMRGAVAQVLTPDATEEEIKDATDLLMLVRMTGSKWQEILPEAAEWQRQMRYGDAKTWSFALMGEYYAAPGATLKGFKSELLIPRAAEAIHANFEERVRRAVQHYALGENSEDFAAFAGIGGLREGWTHEDLWAAMVSFDREGMPQAPSVNAWMRNRLLHYGASESGLSAEHVLAGDIVWVRDPKAFAQLQGKEVMVPGFTELGGEGVESIYVHPRTFNRSERPGPTLITKSNDTWYGMNPATERSGFMARVRSVGPKGEVELQVLQFERQGSPRHIEVPGAVVRSKAGSLEYMERGRQQVRVESKFGKARLEAELLPSASLPGKGSGVEGVVYEGSQTGRFVEMAAPEMYTVEHFYWHPEDIRFLTPEEFEAVRERMVAAGIPDVEEGGRIPLPRSSGRLLPYRGRARAEEEGTATERTVEESAMHNLTLFGGPRNMWEENVALAKVVGKERAELLKSLHEEFESAENAGFRDDLLTPIFGAREEPYLKYPGFKDFWEDNRYNYHMRDVGELGSWFAAFLRSEKPTETYTRKLDDFVLLGAPPTEKEVYGAIQRIGEFAEGGHTPDYYAFLPGSLKEAIDNYVELHVGYLKTKKNSSAYVSARTRLKKELQAFIRDTRDEVIRASFEVALPGPHMWRTKRSDDEETISKLVFYNRSFDWDSRLAKDLPPPPVGNSGEQAWGIFEPSTTNMKRSRFSVASDSEFPYNPTEGNTSNLRADSEEKLAQVFSHASMDPRWAQIEEQAGAMTTLPKAGGGTQTIRQAMSDVMKEYLEDAGFVVINHPGDKESLAGVILFPVSTRTTERTTQRIDFNARRMVQQIRSNPEFTRKVTELATRKNAWAKATEDLDALVVEDIDPHAFPQFWSVGPDRLGEIPEEVSKATRLFKKYRVLVQQERKTGPEVEALAQELQQAIYEAADVSRAKAMEYREKTKAMRDSIRGKMHPAREALNEMAEKDLIGLMSLKPGQPTTGARERRMQAKEYLTQPTVDSILAQRLPSKGKFGKKGGYLLPKKKSTLEGQRAQATSILEEMFNDAYAAGPGKASMAASIDALENVSSADRVALRFVVDQLPPAIADHMLLMWSDKLAAQGLSAGVQVEGTVQTTLTMLLKAPKNSQEAQEAVLGLTHEFSHHLFNYLPEEATTALWGAYQKDIALGVGKGKPGRKGFASFLRQTYKGEEAPAESFQEWFAWQASEYLTHKKLPDIAEAQGLGVIRAIFEKISAHVRKFVEDMFGFGPWRDVNPEVKKVVDQWFDGVPVVEREVAVPEKATSVLVEEVPKVSEGAKNLGPVLPEKPPLRPTPRTPTQAEESFKRGAKKLVKDRARLAEEEEAHRRLVDVWTSEIRPSMKDMGEEKLAYDLESAERKAAYEAAGTTPPFKPGPRTPVEVQAYAHVRSLLDQVAMPELSLPVNSLITRLAEGWAVEQHLFGDTTRTADHALELLLKARVTPQEVRSPAHAAISLLQPWLQEIAGREVSGADILAAVLEVEAQVPARHRRDFKALVDVLRPESGVVSVRPDAQVVQRLKSWILSGDQNLEEGAEAGEGLGQWVSRQGRIPGRSSAEELPLKLGAAPELRRQVEAQEVAKGLSLKGVAARLGNLKELWGTYWKTTRDVIDQPVKLAVKNVIRDLDAVHTASGEVIHKWLKDHYNVRTEDGALVHMLEERFPGTSAAWKESYLAGTMPQDILALVVTSYIDVPRALIDAEKQAALTERFRAAVLAEGSTLTSVRDEVLAASREIFASTPQVWLDEKIGDVALSTFFLMGAQQHDTVRELMGLGAVLDAKHQKLVAEWYMGTGHSDEAAELVQLAVSRPSTYRKPLGSPAEAEDVLHAKQAVFVQHAVQPEPELARRFGTLFSRVPVVAGKFSTPYAARQHMLSLLLETVAVVNPEKAGRLADSGNIFKQSLTSGLITTLPGFHFGNKVGDFIAAAGAMGLLPALKIEAQMAFREVLALPTLSNILTAFRTRWGLEVGDMLFDRMTTLGAWSGDVERLVRGEGVYVTRDGRQYPMPGLLKLARRGDVNDSLVSSNIVRDARNYVGNTYGYRGRALKYMRDQWDHTSAISQYISERRRYAAFLQVIEAGHDPLKAAEIVANTYIDYRHNLHPIERNVFLDFLMPFWNFTKGNVKRLGMVSLTPDLWRSTFTAARAYKDVPEAITAVLDDRDIYGFETDEMPPEMKQRYDKLVMAWKAEGYTSRDIARIILHRLPLDLVPGGRGAAGAQVTYARFDAQLREVFGPDGDSLILDYFNPDTSWLEVPDYSQDRAVVWSGRRKVDAAAKFLRKPEENTLWPHEFWTLPANPDAMAVMEVYHFGSFIKAMGALAVDIARHVEGLAEEATGLQPKGTVEHLEASRPTEQDAIDAVAHAAGFFQNSAQRSPIAEVFNGILAQSPDLSPAMGRPLPAAFAQALPQALTTRVVTYTQDEDGTIHEVVAYRANPIFESMAAFAAFMNFMKGPAAMLGITTGAYKVVEAATSPTPGTGALRYTTGMKPTVTSPAGASAKLTSMAEQRLKMAAPLKPNPISITEEAAHRSSREAASVVVGRMSPELRAQFFQRVQAGVLSNNIPEGRAAQVLQVGVARLMLIERGVPEKEVDAMDDTQVFTRLRAM